MRPDQLKIFLKSNTDKSLESSLFPDQLDPNVQNLALTTNIIDNRKRI